MNNIEIGVLAATAAGIAWVNWFFFFAQRSAASASLGGSGQQEITVVVKGGYEPGLLRVKRGKAVRILFDRQETSGCSEEVVFPDFGIKRFLPAFQTTPVEFTPEQAGTYEFTCGMSMLRGKLVVED